MSQTTSVNISVFLSEKYGKNCSVRHSGERLFQGLEGRLFDFF
ncbi:hypothetical protein THEMA_05345 [Thermotoga maritima MSB8]|nr:hypothetical protein THEMA_05345 [Thermotoga maritima MSB8]